MKRLLYYLVALSVCFGLFSCEEEEFSIEVTNPSSSTLEISSSVFVGGELNAYEIRTYTDTPGEGSLWASDDIGIYGDTPTGISLNPNPFNFEANKQYTWTAGDDEIYEKTSSTSGSSSACSGSYQSLPNVDKQFDFQCEAAYAYKCAGQTSALQQQCDYYKTIQDTYGLPDCPHCK